MIARSVGLLLLALCLAATAAPAAAGGPRTSLTDIESQVMCVTCGVPLSIAESPQADHERGFIRAAIARGETAGQIKHDLVGEFGAGVLGLPPDRGFNLAVYLIPVALIAALAAMLAIAAVRWRRSAGENSDCAADSKADRNSGDPASAGELSAVDSARLDAELARYDG